MIWLYRILFLPFLIVALPYYLKRMLRRGGYRHDFHHRFGLIDRPPRKPKGVKRLWIQAVSVGEIQALSTLIKELKSRPDVEIILTTTTSTGYAILRERFSRDVCKVGIFPLDFAPFSRNAWRRLDPDLAVMMESELWPEHLHQAALRKVPVVLINARLSDRSLKRYTKIKPLAQRLLSKVHTILTASDQDRDRFIHLGYPADKIQVTGNLKLDAAPNIRLDAPSLAQLRNELGFGPDSSSDKKQPLVLLGSSTWPNEEKVLLDVWREAEKLGLDCRLLLVPRHAERRDELISWLKTQSVKVAIRSQDKQAQGSTQVYLADTTGELARLSQVADVAFIGKSLPPNDGGQTPIEAAALGLPMVYGPAMSNFRQVCRSLESSHAAIRCPDTKAVKAAILRLLQDKAERATLSQNAQTWHKSNLGSSERTARVLQGFLNLV